MGDSGEGSEDEKSGNALRNLEVKAMWISSQMQMKNY
jgi:hypothetical protein